MITTQMPERLVDHYILIHMPDHPRAYPSGYVPEHVLVAESLLGRGLMEGEYVRHLNGKVQDNRPENLYVSTGQYRHSIGLVEEIEHNRKEEKTFMPCRFQKTCWLTVRAPMARREKIYLPYVCSYQSDGDLYLCSRFWTFKENELQGEMEVGTDGNLQSAGTAGDDLQGEVRDNS